MQVTFPAYKSYEYVEVWQILERRDGCIYKTKSIGFAHRNRPLGKDETYSPLSTTLTKDNNEITLELIP
jgi:hypothetical protein